MARRPRILMSAALGAVLLAGLALAPTANANAAYPAATCEGLLDIGDLGLPVVVGTQQDAIAYGFTPGENVTLSIGSVPVATAPADSGGSVEFTPVIPDTVPQGQQTATALGATSKCAYPAAVDVVTPTATTLTLAPAAPAAGAPVTLVAAVSDAYSAVTGSVEFSVDGLPVASVKVVKGVARATLTQGLGAGRHDLLAAFGQTSTESASSASVAAVTRTGSVATLTLSKHRVTYGDSLSGTVRVPASDGGNAVVRFGSTRVTVPLDSNHDARFRIAGGALPAGTDQVTARYAGTASIAPSPTVSAPVQVAKAATTVSLAAPSVTTRGRSINVHFAVHGRLNGLRPGGVIALLVVTNGSERRINLTVPADGAGRTRLTLSRLGRTAISLRYHGDADYLASRSRTLKVDVDR